MPAGAPMKCVSRERPVAWGKLPAYADFIRIGSPGAHAACWGAWFGAHPVASLATRSTKTARRAAPGIDWHELQPREWTDKPFMHAIPWCFVLPPGALGFAANDRVVGAMSESCDKVGRRHPFVIYQIVSGDWMVRHLASARSPLFWWARLLAQYTPPVIQTSHTVAGADLDARLERLSALYRRPWWQALGPWRPPDARACRDAVGHASDNDPATALEGVSTPPWAPLPRDDRKSARFWQQDDAGRYVGMKVLDLDSKEFSS